MAPTTLSEARCTAGGAGKSILPLPPGSAAFALQDDALAAGQARFLCILVGVAIGTLLMLILSSDRLGRI
jgi:hypothetical protein